MWLRSRPKQSRNSRLLLSRTVLTGFMRTSIMMSSFQIWSNLVFPHGNRNIHISAELSLLSLLWPNIQNRASLQVYRSFLIHVCQLYDILLHYTSSIRFLSYYWHQSKPTLNTANYWKQTINISFQKSNNRYVKNQPKRKRHSTSLTIPVIVIATGTKPPPVTQPRVTRCSSELNCARVRRNTTKSQVMLVQPRRYPSYLGITCPLLRLLPSRLLLLSHLFPSLALPNVLLAILLLLLQPQFLSSDINLHFWFRDDDSLFVFAGFQSRVFRLRGVGSPCLFRRRDVLYPRRHRRGLLWRRDFYFFRRLFRFRRRFFYCCCRCNRCSCRCFRSRWKR